MRILVIIIMCCMATEVVHGFYYNTKIILSSKDLDYVREADKGYRSFPAFMVEIKKQYPDREIYVCSPDQYYLNDASKLGYKAIFDFENLWSADLIVKTKSLLIMPVHKQEVPIMKKYIDNKKPQLVSDIAGTYFYKEEINPK